MIISFSVFFGFISVLEIVYNNAKTAVLSHHIDDQFLSKLKF